MNPIPPGLPVETFEIPTGPPTDLPEAGAPPLPPPPTWIDQQRAVMAEREAQEAEAAAQEAVGADAKAAEIEALRQKHGALVSGSGAFLRGALDALLAPAAGVAAEIETAGEALGNVAQYPLGVAAGIGQTLQGGEPGGPSWLHTNQPRNLQDVVEPAKALEREADDWGRKGTVLQHELSRYQAFTLEYRREFGRNWDDPAPKAKK